jgi:hypothetical protein
MTDAFTFKPGPCPICGNLPNHPLYNVRTHEEIECNGDEELFGHCDVCNLPHQVASNQDHCVECGNCLEHCVDPKKHYPLQFTLEKE